MRCPLQREVDEIVDGKLGAAKVERPEPELSPYRLDGRIRACVQPLTRQADW